MIKQNVGIDYLPKVGERGLAVNRIHLRLEPRNWLMSGHVASFMRKNGIRECWFQVFDSKHVWQWCHGVVELKNGKAVITQIG